jgi:uncharacterized membrane protein
MPSPQGAAPGVPTTRLLHLDVLRGAAVATMVLAHVIDAWTRPADRVHSSYFLLVFISGIASPLFLLLAGLAGTLSAASRARASGSRRGGAAAVRHRGWEIFVLGLVFRVQSQVLGLGPIRNLFKVDILNIMGLALVLVSWLWQCTARRPARLVLFAVAASVVAGLTPLVRAAAWPAGLPDLLEAYLRPAGGLSAFPWFPWAGFLFAGALMGEFVDAARGSARRQGILQTGTVLVGAVGIWLAWLASWQPALFPTARFWHDSPAFFSIRLGVAALAMPAAWLLATLGPQGVVRRMATFGRSSLFVYWIHVEMVYGVAAQPLRQRLPLWVALAGVGVMVALLYGAVLLKNRLLGRYGLKGALRVLAPVLR